MVGTCGLVVADIVLVVCSVLATVLTSPSWTVRDIGDSIVLTEIRVDSVVFIYYETYVVGSLK